MAKSKIDPGTIARETRLVAAAREFSEHGMVNPAVYHASTVLYPSVQALIERTPEYQYGRRGTPTSRALEAAIAMVEGGYAAKVCPSGLSAVSTTLLSLLNTGDRLLMVDTVYQPSRHFCDTVLARLGIETEYYDPLIGAGIADLIRPNTRLIFCESPGSQTMEVQDVPAIVAAGHAAGCRVAIDNTWSGGYYFDAFSYGCDVSVQAATKYLVGHSDAMLGSVTCTEETWPLVKGTYEALGLFTGPDDMYLGLRGLRTLDVRLDRHMRNALTIANWLSARPEVAEVLCPALPGAQPHDLRNRDFTAANGPFSIILHPPSERQIPAMLHG